MIYKIGEIGELVFILKLFFKKNSGKWCLKLVKLNNQTDVHREIILFK